MSSGGKSQFEGLGKKYVLTVLAACCAETATLPFDVTKTRLQVQGETSAGASGPKKGLLKTGISIAREEGVLKLWKGLQPALARHVIYMGIRVNAYEVLRNQIAGDKSADSLSFYHRVVCAASAGAIGQFVASPTDLVKVRMQTEVGPSSSATKVFTDALRNGGVTGLWKGCIPNVQRAALVSLGDMAGYDQGKTILVNHLGMESKSPLTHFFASIGAGVLAATLGTPADVVKTRVMNQPVDVSSVGKYYKNSVDCLVKTVKNEGPGALYKGFVPFWMRKAPWNLVFWLAYEQFRILSGVGTW